MMAPAYALLNTTEFHVQVKLYLLDYYTNKYISVIISFFYIITAFCDDDVKCNGRGKCDNNGVCQCDDSFYGDSCLGNFEYLAIQEIMC